MRLEQRSTEEAAFVPRLLTHLVEKVCQRPWLVLGTALVLCALSVYSACSRLEYHTQRNDLDSPHKDYQERWRRYVAEFGDDDDIVAVVKGNDRQRMQDALDALAVEIGRKPELFDRLFYKVDLRSLRNRALLFLPADQIRRIQDNLENMRMLLEWPPVGRHYPSLTLIGWKSLTLLRLLEEARGRIDKIEPQGPLRADDEQFLTQLHAISRSATNVLNDPVAYRNPWGSLLDQPPQQQDLLNRPQYFFSADGSLAFLLVHPVKEEGSFTAANRSVAAMRKIVAEVAHQYPELELGLTGLPVLENDEMVASQQDTNLASWLALAGVAVLYLVVFRSWRSPFLTLTTLLVGTVWALGWLTLTVGHLNILSATFAVMLIGMGDYGILWVTRYQEERAGGADAREAMRRTASCIGGSILTAALTTALAFYAAMLADFQAVAELGWIAGCGVLLCALACFTVMPALLTIMNRRPSSLVLRPSSFARDKGQGTRDEGPRTRWVVGAGFTLAGVLAIFAGQVDYDHNLLHLQARDLDSVKWECTLIQHTAGASWHALSYTSTPEEALALKARYEQLPGVSRVVEVASLVPADQEKKLDQLRDIERRLRRLPERGTVIPHALPNVARLKTTLDRLVASLQASAETNISSPAQKLFQELRPNLASLREALDKAPADVSAERLRHFEQRLAGDLAEDLHRLRDVSTPAGIAVADLPPELRARYIGQSGKWLLRVFGKECLWDYEPLARFVDEIHSVDPEATGKPFSTLEGLRSMKQGFQWAGLYALAAIVLVLLADFRKPLHVLMALTPLAIGVVVALGIMGLCGLPLNPANMIAFPLILGVGVDNGVHVLHDYLARRGQGAYALQRSTGWGILTAALTTVLGFGALMISRHRGLFSLGFTLALGVTCCMLSALVFLPALLRLLGGRDGKEETNEKMREEKRLAA